MDLELTLDQPTAEFVAAKVAAGEYASPEDVVRAALRLLEDHEKLRALRAAIQEGADSEDAGTADEVMAELKTELEQYP